MLNQKAFNLNRPSLQIVRLLSNQKPADSSKSDNKSYQVPEYYQYDAYSYFDIEKDMVKYRQPQPSSLPHVEYTWSQVPPKTPAPKK